MRTLVLLVLAFSSTVASQRRSQFTRYRSWNSRMYPVWKDGDPKFRNCWFGGEVTFDVKSDAPTLTGAKTTFSISLNFPPNQTALSDGQVVWARNCTINGRQYQEGQAVYPDRDTAQTGLFPDGTPFSRSQNKKPHYVFVWKTMGRYWQVADGPSSSLTIGTDNVPLGSYNMEVVIYHCRGKNKFIPLGYASSVFSVTDQIPFTISLAQVNDINQDDQNFIQNRAIAFNVKLHDPSQYLSNADVSFSWDFGDSTGTLISRDLSVTHTYLAVGTFKPQVVLMASIPNGCGTPTAVAPVDASVAPVVVVVASTAAAAAPAEAGEAIALDVAASDATPLAVSVQPAAAAAAAVEVASVAPAVVDAAVVPEEEDAAAAAAEETDAAAAEDLGTVAPVAEEPANAEDEAVVAIDAAEGDVAAIDAAVAVAPVAEGEAVEVTDGVTVAPLAEEAAEGDVVAADAEVAAVDADAAAAADAAVVDAEAEAAVVDAEAEAAVVDAEAEAAVVDAEAEAAVVDAEAAAVETEAEAAVVEAAADVAQTEAEAPADNTVAPVAAEAAAVEEAADAAEAEVLETENEVAATAAAAGEVQAEVETDPAQIALVVAKRQAPELTADCNVYRYGSLATSVEIVQGIESVEIVQMSNVVSMTTELDQNAVDISISCQGSLPSEVCTVISDADCVTPVETICNAASPSPDCQIVLRQFFNDTGVFCVNVSLTNDVSLAVASARVSVSAASGGSPAGTAATILGVMVLACVVCCIGLMYRRFKQYQPLTEDHGANNGGGSAVTSVPLLLWNLLSRQSPGESRPLLQGRVV